jgi:uncharacterized protein (TIGR00661 family)
MFIIQGEGRGHLSQAMSLQEYLSSAGHHVETAFVGKHPAKTLPGYFMEAFKGKIRHFRSPYFLYTPNRKGIYVGLTILFNLTRTHAYMSAIRQIRNHIISSRPDVVFNFYDGIGALAMRKIPGEIHRVAVGHHFTLHLEGYQCGASSPLHKRLLAFHTRLVLSGCDTALALSFREMEGDDRIRVVPPLVRKRFREATYKPGDRYLVYLLKEGFISDLVRLAGSDPGFKADVFSDLPTDTPVPVNLSLYPVGDPAFHDLMKTCRGLITTAGFDIVAEAAYMGIPVGLIPVGNHFEQRCNSMDAERGGAGTILSRLDPVSLEKLVSPVNESYREWADQADDMIIKEIEE